MYKEHTIIVMDPSENVINCYHSKNKITMRVMIIIVLCSCVLSTAASVVSLKKPQEPKKIKNEIFNLTNLTFFELLDEIKKINMSIDYSSDIWTRDVSKINTAVDAASFLIGIVQTYLGKNKQNKSESPAGVVINNNIKLLINPSNVNDTIRVQN